MIGLIILSIASIVISVLLAVLVARECTSCEPTLLDWIIGIVCGIGTGLVALLVALLILSFCLTIPVSDVTTSEELFDTKQLRALNDQTGVEGEFSGGIFVSSGSLNEEAVYVFYYEDKESGGIKYGSIPAEATTIYLIGDNEKPRVEEYNLNSTCATLLTAPVEVLYETSKKYKLYVPEGSITTDITLDLEK